MVSTFETNDRQRPVPTYFVFVGMLLCTLATIGWKGVSAAVAPTIRFRSSGREPELTLPKGATYHAFVSHVW